MENYANWFAYYRTRIQAVKTATSLVFKELDNKFRVGFHTLSNNPTSDFAERRLLRRGAEDDVVQQAVRHLHQDRAGDAEPQCRGPRRRVVCDAAATRELAAATDPIVPTLTCQKNWHMLFTDGITNQPAVPTTVVGNVDRLIPALPEDLSVQGLDSRRAVAVPVPRERHGDQQLARRLRHLLLVQGLQARR